MLGLFFGGRRRSPAFFYLRLALIAAFLIATFVLHASAADVVDLRIARIVLIVLFVVGARFAASRRQSPWLGRPQSAQIDAAGGQDPSMSSEDRTWPAPRRASPNASPSTASARSGMTALTCRDIGAPRSRQPASTA